MLIFITVTFSLTFFDAHIYSMFYSEVSGGLPQKLTFFMTELSISLVLLAKLAQIPFDHES